MAKVPLMLMFFSWRIAKTCSWCEARLNHWHRTPILYCDQAIALPVFLFVYFFSSEIRKQESASCLVQTNLTLTFWLQSWFVKIYLWVLDRMPGQQACRCSVIDDSVKIANSLICWRSLIDCQIRYHNFVNCFYKPYLPTISSHSTVSK